MQNKYYVYNDRHLAQSVAEAKGNVLVLYVFDHKPLSRLRT